MNKYFQQLSLLYNINRLMNKLMKDMEVDPCLYNIGDEEECMDKAKTILSDIQATSFHMEDIWSNTSNEARGRTVTAIHVYNINIINNIEEIVCEAIDDTENITWREVLRIIVKLRRDYV